MWTTYIIDTGLVYTELYMNFKYEVKLRGKNVHTISNNGKKILICKMNMRKHFKKTLI